MVQQSLELVIVQIARPWAIEIKCLVNGLGERQTKVAMEYWFVRLHLDRTQQCHIRRRKQFVHLINLGLLVQLVLLEVFHELNASGALLFAIYLGVRGLCLALSLLGLRLRLCGENCSNGMPDGAGTVWQPDIPVCVDLMRAPVDV